MNLVTRKQWRARRPRNTQPIGKLEGVAVHYSAAESDRQDRHANCAARVRGIQNFHMDFNKWADIAYNYLVCRHGYVFEGRGLQRRSAAQGTNPGNDHFLAVCFLGNDREGRDDLTPEGRIALIEICSLILARVDSIGVLRPHSSFHPTACPGNELRRFLSAYNRLVRSGG